MRTAVAVVLALLIAGCVDPGTSLPAPAPAPAVAGEVTVHFVDVGQGDGTVWRLPSGATVVYDCGPPADDAASNPVVRRLHELGLQAGDTVDVLIASHGHVDHIGGCEEIFETFRIEQVFDYGYTGDDAPASYQRHWADAVGEGTTLFTFGAEGESGRFHAGFTHALAGTAIEFLWPDTAAHTWDDIARASSVVRLTHGASRFCFQGDIDRSDERVLASRIVGGCDVLLVGHHGSRHASDATWLEAIDPTIAIASFGQNRYGHPTSEALCRVAQAGATIYTTHRAGGVTIEADAQGAVRVTHGVEETIDYCRAGADYWA